MNLFATTTDAGSDEAKAKRLKLVYSAHDAAHWEFPADCFCHQFQLMVLCILLGLDWVLKSLGREYKLWSALAKICHSWRDKTTDMFLAFTDILPASCFKACEAHRVPPRPLVGRWGVIHECVRRVLLIGCPKLLRIGFMMLDSSETMCLSCRHRKPM